LVLTPNPPLASPAIAVRAATAHALATINAHHARARVLPSPRARPRALRHATASVRCIVSDGIIGADVDGASSRRPRSGGSARARSIARDDDDRDRDRDRDDVRDDVRDGDGDRACGA
jgi:hypothetical protein